MVVSFLKIEPLKETRNTIFTDDECLVFISQSHSPASLNLKYLNRCPWDVNVNLCISYEDGSSSLKKIANVSKGSWSQNILDKSANIKAVKGEAFSGKGKPPIPEACQLPSASV